MDGAAQIQNANLVSTVSTVGSVANFGTGQFGALAATNTFTNTLNANNISTSFAQSPLFSTVNINLSTINGVNWLDISSSVTTVSSFNDLKTSSFKVSSMSGTVGQVGVGSTIFTDSGFQFTGQVPFTSGGNRFLSSVRTINSIGENLLIQASTNSLSWTGGINPDGYVRIGSGGAFDSYFLTINGDVSLSTQQLLAKSTIVEECVVSSFAADGGLPIKVKNVLQFALPNAVDNCSAINLNSDFIQQLTIQASTILLGANNTTVQSLSSVRHSTASLSFSTATSVGSNTAFNYPIFIDHDTAGNITTGGVAIAVQGHNLAAGAVRNQIEMGTRANGENYIAASWPGQNLEDLYIDATETIFRDGTFSTIINLDPYGLITNGGISAPSLLVSSINGNNAQVAFANVIQLSSMNLYQNNSTICWWDSISPNTFVNASGYDITVGQNGTYKVGASRQFSNQSGSDVVEYYFIKNGQAIEYSNSKTQVINNSELVTYSEIIETLVNGDVIQLGQYTTSSDIYLSTFPGAYCSSPAVIATIYKIA
jgi:hypothetical protein